MCDATGTIRFTTRAAHRGRGTTYRLWDSETTYKVVTRLVQRIPENLFTRQMVPGFTYIQRGYCELTPEGRRVLTEVAEKVTGPNE